MHNQSSQGSGVPQPYHHPPPAYDHTAPYDNQAYYPQPQPQVQPHPSQQYGHNVVVVQPPPPQQPLMASGEYVPDNLVISIISIFFCCILGIVATIKANDARESLQRGHIESAKASSALAKKLAIAAIITGCVCIVLSIVVGVVLPIVVVASVASSSSESFSGDDISYDTRYNF